MIAAFTINGFLALGEETGWRGWLLQAVSPLHQLAIIVVTGAIWGLWHAPLIFMGYEYNNEINPVLGTGLFSLVCIALGAVFIWLRVHSQSVLPAAVGHGTFNALAPLPALFLAGDAQWNMATGSVVGLAGFIAFAVIASALFLLRPIPSGALTPTT